jgi:hypothetical protein
VPHSYIRRHQRALIVFSITVLGGPFACELQNKRRDDSACQR